MHSSIAVDREASVAVSQDHLHRGALVGAAGLIGFGLILFIAANWDALSRFQRFWLAASVVAAGGLAALVRETWRVPGLLLSLAASGGLLALIGQTYQTGADTWQLFALWAGLTLPFAVAARSDAVWTPWVLVAATAITLWFQTNGIMDVLWARPDSVFAGRAAIAGVPVAVLATWGASLALSAAIVSMAPLDRLLGARRWAFRLAMALSMALVTTHAVTFLMAGPRARIEVYFVGLSLLVAMATWLAKARDRDVLLIAASAFAIDVALIFGFVRMIWPTSRGGDFGVYLVIGLFCAAIVAASVVMIMGLLRGGASADTATAAATAADSPRHVDAPRPWPVVVLSGIGALMAAVPFIAAAGVLLGRALTKGPAIYVIAAVLIPSSAIWLRKARGLFVEQLATVALATGMLLLGWGIFRDLPLGAAGTIAGLIGIGMALALGRAWIAALLGAASTVGFALALQSLLPDRIMMPGAAQYALIWSILGLAGFLAALGFRGNRGWLEPLGRVGVGEETVDATISGWLGAALAGLAFGSGASFLVGAHMGGIGGMGLGGEATVVVMAARATSVMLAAAGAIWLSREVPSLRSPIAIAVMATVVALSWAMPALGAAALLLALSIVTRRRVVGVAAAAAALWIAGAFYYNLAMPLTQKAAILAGAGAGALLGIVSVALGGRAGVVTSAMQAAVPMRSLAMPAMLTFAGLAAVGGVAFQAISSKEALISDGAPVYVELVPVDPRSLMQGDYMALRFRLPPADVRRPWPAGTRPLGIGMRDARGVLTIARVADAAAPFADGETRIALRRGSVGQWIVVTDAWYFKEGTADRWTAARYGEFRVLPDGSALLVGLADKDLNAIR